jgi:PEP-CTERM motif-containing protein
VLTFGALAGNNTIGVNLDLTAADNVGFQGNFLVGTAGPAGGGGAGVPEPGTLAIFLSALLGWFGIRLRQQKKDAGVRMA